MNIEFTEYSPNTGEFTVVRGIPEEMAKEYANIPYVLGFHDGETEYFDLKSRQVKSRPEMPIKHTLTNNGILVSQIPPGTHAAIADEEFIIDDGELEWSSPIPGEWGLSLTNFPYQPVTLKVVVPES